MAIELSEKAKIKAASPQQSPQLVLAIEGYDKVFGVGEVKEYAYIGMPDLLIGDDWVIGGLFKRADQEDLIDLNGSSNTISQQLLQDRGGTSSVPSIQISLIDKDGEITDLITPEKVLPDILGRKAYVYLGYQDTAWPQDFVRIFAGVIDEVKSRSTIILNIAHPEQKKRASIFQNITTELMADARFRSRTVEGVTYRTRRDVVGIVTINKVAGGTVGSEVVTVSGNNITIQIDSGDSQARHLRNALENSVAAMALIDVEINTGESNTPQNVGTFTLDSDTTLELKTTQGFILPAPAYGFKTYVQINDEVIEYTGISGNTLTGCTREALAFRDERAEGAHHEAGDSVSTFYRIQGDAVTLALRVLLSGGPKYFANDVAIKSIAFVEDIGPIANALWFEGRNIEDDFGLVVGDLVTVTGDQVAGNNVVDAEIADVIATPTGSYLILGGVSLTQNPLSAGVASFASKYNVLPEGAGLKLGGDEVDVPEFERLLATFSSSFLSYDFYLKDTVNGKEFIDTEVLFPTGAFSLPRKGKVSIGYTSPPLGNQGLKVLDSTNTTRPQDNTVTRSLTKNFYNTVVFKYDEAVVDARFLAGDVTIDEDSKARIAANTTALVIESKGARPSAETEAIISILRKRFTDKYKYAAELISTSAFYGKVFDVDVGDVVAFGDSILDLPDTKTGSRNFAPRLFEVVNKSLNIKTGDVRLELLDSAYSLNDGRYGVISPSSLTVAAGSTTTQIKIKNSFQTVAPRLERTKWAAMIGYKILVHDQDFAVEAETTLLGFSPSDPYLMLVDPPLPFVVSDDYVVDVAHYPTNTNAEDQALAKKLWVYTNFCVDVLAGTNQLTFTVPALDAGKFLVGAVVLVRNEDFTVVSPEVRVESISGADITISTPLGFVPLAGYQVDLIGYADGGAPYRYI